MKKRTLAARYFFRNCTVSVYTPGKLEISRTLTPSPGDYFINRSFILSVDLQDHFNSPFFRFLEETSPSSQSLNRKMEALGYMLCNKLPRSGQRLKGFICVNERPGASSNGKTFFARALEKFCRTVMIDGRQQRLFWISDIRPDTEICIIDDVCINRTKGIIDLYPLITED